MDVEALDGLHAHDALVLGLVREHRRAGHVADRIDALRGRLEPVGDLDEATLGELDARLLGTDGLDVRRASGGDEDVAESREVRAMAATSASACCTLSSLARCPAADSLSADSICLRSVAAFRTAAIAVPSAILSAVQGVSGTGGCAPRAMTLPVNIPSAGATSVNGRASSQ